MKWKDLLFDLTYYPIEFCKDWIYPAYYLKNLLLHRYDLVRLKELKSYRYCDCSERILLANMTLIVDFIEKENPEKYVMWYKDDNGEDVGNRYGIYGEVPACFAEYKGKFIMDIIKEIYYWWTVEYVDNNNDYDYILHYWADALYGEFDFDAHDEKGNDEPSPLLIDKSKTIKSFEELENRSDIRWDILDRYFKREDLLNEDCVRNCMKKLEIKKSNDIKKYLHLCVEIREYLWT